MNRRRVAALLRALAEEIDEPAERIRPADEPRREVSDLVRDRGQQALRRAGLIGSGARTRQPRRKDADAPKG